MRTIITKKFILLSLLTGLALVASACVKKPEVQPVNQNQNANAATTTSEIDTVTGWKIYRNAKYGFEMQYPSEWILVESDQKIEFYSKAWQDEEREFFKGLIGSELTLSFYPNAEDIDYWALTSFDLEYSDLGEDIGNEFIKFEPIKFNDKDIKSVITAGERSTQTFFFESSTITNGIVVLSMDSFHKEKRSILSTIKF